VFNFSDIYEALDQSGGAVRAETDEDFVKSLGQLLVNPVARQRSVEAAEGVVNRLGGALDKTLGALEPYLLQLRLEGGSADA
jgi:3-deoxy-D-manno-octulosonic-acid transferase